MKWFKEDDLKDVNTLRSAYKRLVIKYHPDNNTEDITTQMQEINSEYDKLFQKLKDSYEKSESYEKQTDRQKQAYDFVKDQKIKGIIIALCRFAKFDIKIEIIGTWVWVTGNRHTVSMSYIRDKYGSVIINTQEENKESRRLQQC